MRLNSVLYPSSKAMWSLLQSSIHKREHLPSHPHFLVAVIARVRAHKLGGLSNAVILVNVIASTCPKFSIEPNHLATTRETLARKRL